MKKRLFVALELPKELKDNIVHYQQDIINDYKDTPRLTAKENLHITVSFLDTIDESIIPGLIIKLDEVTKEVSSFKLEYTSTILGPPGRFPSMIWIVYKSTDVFTRLMKEINGRVVQYLKSNKQPVLLSSHQNPTPHITLARFKSKIQPTLTSFPPFSIPELPISSFTLMHSQLSPKGSTYIPLETYYLG